LRRKEPRIHINILPMDFIWTTLPAANNPKLLKKILQFNDEVREKYKSSAVFNTRGKYILGERETILLESVFTSLQQSTKSPTKSSSFDCEALDIVLQLLSWPVDNLFPVIDLIRVLILQESAAVYYSKMNVKGVSIISVLVQLMKVHNISPICLQICLKLIINLFRHKCFHLLLIIDANLIITYLSNVLPQLNYAEDGDRKIALACSQIFYNYALLWMTGPSFKHQTHYDTVKILIKSDCKLLKNDSLQDDTKILLLTSLATIIQNDCRISLQLKPVEPFLSSQNPKIRDCAIFIIECLHVEVHSHLTDIKN